MSYLYAWRDSLKCNMTHQCVKLLTRVYTRHVAHSCWFVAWLISMRDTTHSWLINVTHDINDSFMRDITYQCLRAPVFVAYSSWFVTWLICKHDVTHLYVTWLMTDQCVTYLTGVYTRLGTHSCWCVAWLICMRDVTQIFVWHDSLFCEMCMTYLFVWHDTKCDEWHDKFQSVTWLTSMCAMTH